MRTAWSPSSGTLKVKRLGLPKAANRRWTDNTVVKSTKHCTENEKLRKNNAIKNMWLHCVLVTTSWYRTDYIGRWIQLPHDRCNNILCNWLLYINLILKFLLFLFLFYTKHEYNTVLTRHASYCGCIIMLMCFLNQYLHNICVCTNSF